MAMGARADDDRLAVAPIKAITSNAVAVVSNIKTVSESDKAVARAPHAASTRYADNHHQLWKTANMFMADPKMNRERIAVADAIAPIRTAKIFCGEAGEERSQGQEV